ncbi:MAG: sigma-54-dependent Fis family transcriptional regulator, partial [Opitutales bacterium]|nr:sigma-54-dependent Fis family transcriptional regulator [Opitutales bacterium]
MRSVLIVDDEKHTRDGLSAVLADSYDVFAASNADEAISMLDAEPFDAVITDLRMAGKSGMSVIDKTISMPEKPVCIMLTAYGSMEIAVEAMKRGATDFLPKPVDVDKLETILEQALEKREQKKKIVESENKKNIETAKKAHGTSSVVEAKHIDIGCFIATSKVMKEVVEKAMQVAHSKASVMLTGETGTGKELFARLIHSASPRKDAPFLPVHCAALPANLLESELFGYEKGAFTGANQRRIGRFEAADKGTIFLDEIGEIDAQTQVKLLRFLETKTFERLGSSQSLKVDVRLVCATNKDLKAMCD